MSAGLQTRLEVEQEERARLARTQRRAATRAAACTRSPSTPTARASRATATASCTRARSAASSTRRRSSSTTRATTTGTASRTRSRGADRTHAGARAAPQRGPRGSRGARARPRPHTLRPRRRARARRAAGRRRRLRPQPPDAAHRGLARGALPGLPGAEPHARDARGHPEARQRLAAPGADACAAGLPLARAQVADHADEIAT